MTPEEALQRLVEHADVITRHSEGKELHRKQFLLLEADESLMEFLATFRSETEDMEPDVDDEENGDREGDYADWEAEHDNEPDYVNSFPPDYGEGSQVVTSTMEYRKLFMRS